MVSKGYRNRKRKANAKRKEARYKAEDLEKKRKKKRASVRRICRAEPGTDRCMRAARRYGRLNRKVHKSKARADKLDRKYNRRYWR